MEEIRGADMKIKYRLSSEEVQRALINYAVSLGAILPYSLDDVEINVEDGTDYMDIGDMFAEIAPVDWSEEEEEDSEQEDDDDYGDDEDDDGEEEEEDEDEGAEKGHIDDHVVSASDSSGYGRKMGEWK